MAPDSSGTTSTTTLPWVVHVLENVVSIAVYCDMCNRLGVPLPEEKCEGLATHIIFLGIKIDSMAMELRLPLDKLHRIQDELQCW